MSRPSPSPAALRTRRWRDRQNHGVRLVRLELRDDTLDDLRDAGLLRLDYRDDDDAEAVAGAVRHLLERLAASVTRHAPADDDRLSSPQHQPE